MKLILDEGMPLRAARALRDANLDARHVLELGMGGASDEAILGKAEAEGAIIATLDADFHRILAITGAKGPSVIRVRIEGLNGPQLAVLLRSVLERTEEELRAGAALSVNANRLRVRRLPLRE
jgi:predicted nuclease of predicted toxin-antitoxin system